VSCSVLQVVAVSCRMLNCIAVCYSVCCIACCSILQCVAVRGIEVVSPSQFVVQCVAMCSRAL